LRTLSPIQRVFFIVVCVLMGAFAFTTTNQTKNERLAYIASCTQRSATLISIDGIREHTVGSSKKRRPAFTVYGVVELPEQRAQIDLHRFVDDREAAERYRQQTPTNQTILVYKTLDPAEPIISEDRYLRLHQEARDASRNAKLFLLVCAFMIGVALIMPSPET
jgi:hypothetical protein